jgi:hypothetical protein
MKHQRAGRAIRYDWISMAAPWVGSVFFAFLIAGLWFKFVNEGSLKIALYAAPMIILVSAITLWQQSRTRAKNRDAVLKAYAENEIARASIVHNRHTFGDQHSASVTTIA